jgi:hypothetical protein
VDGFFLLLGHLLGDYVLQDDWQAGNKVARHPGPCPSRAHLAMTAAQAGDRRDWASAEEAARVSAAYVDWCQARQQWWVGHLACTVHCLLYTLAVWACTFWWMPWWGLVACFCVHWPVDRFRLAARSMQHLTNQELFARLLAPWSVIVVDNTWHLATLGLVAAAAGRVG